MRREVRSLFAALCFSTAGAVAAAQETFTLRLSNTVTLDFVALPGTPALWVGRTPITMAQFREFVDETNYQTDAENPAGNGPGRVGGHGWSEEQHRFEGWFPQYTWRYSGWPLTDQHPASNISWNDAMKFCEWLAAKVVRNARLPTTLEWDRATRAGTSTAYFSGEDPATLEGFANVADRSLLRAIGRPEYARGGFPFDDGYPFTSPVASFKPNPWGLYDMIGNVFEWCSGRSGPKICGCSYNDEPQMCREDGELRSVQPYSRYAYFGFRVVVAPSGSR
ncbi:MAG: hypothetical protein NVS4B3_25380 [Gemmatimonadaceae bacterium]